MWLLVGMVLWFAHEMAWSDQVPFYRDLGPYFYPLRFSLAQSFKAGELPLWDRHMGMGFPLLADFQSGAFYPPHLLFLLLPFFTAIRALFLFHYLVAATGGYMLCRYWNYPLYLAVLGALLFTLGGTIVSLSNLLNHFQTAVWLPWVLYSWEKTLRGRSGKDFLFLTLLLLLQLLAGSPELYVMTAGLLFLDGIRIHTGENLGAYSKSFLILVAANCLVAGLAMIQILPTLELLLESRGYKPIVYLESSLWSLQPSSLINLFFLDKEVNTAAGSGIRLFFQRDIPLFISYYMGAISLIGICLWSFYSSRKEKTLLVGSVIVSLALAVGGYTPVYPLLFRYVPFFSLFRFPEKFFFLIYAFLLFMALEGIFRFVQSKGSIKGPVTLFSCICFLLFLLYLFLRLDTATLSRFIARMANTPLFSIDTITRTSGVMVNLERQIVLTVGVLVLLFSWKIGKLHAALFKTLLVGLVFIDLTSAHRPYHFLLNPDLVYHSPRVIADPDPEPHRLFYYPRHSYLHPNYYSILRQPSFPEFQSLVFGNLLPNTGVFHGFDYLQELDALRRWTYLVFLGVANNLPPEQLYRLLGALNVKYLVSFRDLPGKGISLVRHFPEHPSWLYRLNRAVPRAYVVSKVTVEKEPAKVLERLSSDKFDPLKEVILGQSLSIVPHRDFRGRASMVDHANTRATVRASLNGSGALVLADHYYPGWRVYVDGTEQEIVRANLFYRAVRLSAGEHLVEFRYQPRSLTIGLIISVIALSGIVLSLFYLWLSGRRNKEGDCKRSAGCNAYWLGPFAL
ncbi:MAG: YfhO family protein [Deltaproteobacteria bacterium]|nr:YfhO family protein [Deltaproteobacteria bacterium]